MSRRVAAAGIAAVLLVGALLAVLLLPSDHSAGDNAKPIVIGVVVPGERTFCQANNVFPSDARRLRVWVSTAGEPGGPLNVVIRKGGRTLATGRAPGGYVDSPVTIPLERRVLGSFTGASVCIHNGWEKQAAFMGDRVGPGEAPARAGTARQPQVTGVPGNEPARIKGVPESKQQPIVARIDFRRSADESWLDLAPTIAQRASYARPGFFGEWTLFALVGVMLLVGAGAITLVARQTPVE
jgi:hypothetical protein